jgi:predicted membrane protein
MTPGNGNPGGGGQGNPPPDWRTFRYQQKMQRRMQRAEWRAQHHGPRAAFPGLILLLIGAAFLLNNLGLFDFQPLRLYWPVILIVIGVGVAAFPRHGARSLLWSAMLFLLGGIFLAQNFGYVRGNIWEVLWPVWIIFWGLMFLFKPRPYGGPWGGPWGGSCGGAPWMGGSATTSNANRLNESTVFGGVKQRVDSQEFEGGYLSAVFSGIEIDLSGANTKLDELYIQADAVFGGIELLLPDRWNVTVNGTGMFGGYENQTRPPMAAAGEKVPHVVVSGSAVFGGVTIRN